MSDFKNPFTGLTRREYNITNLKKVLDTFPTSLQTKQLTSTELLERLEDIIANRDMTIEELRAQLGNRNAVGSDIEDINNELSNLADSIDLDRFVDEATEQADEDGKVATLKGRGFKRIGDTPLFINVNRNMTESHDFLIYHGDERTGWLGGGNGIKESDFKSPRSVEFANISEEKSVYIKKDEVWTSNTDSKSAPSNTNAFKFDKYPLLHSQAYEIGPDEETSTDLSLSYKSPESLKGAGLKRDGRSNEWLGDMKIRVSVGSSNNIDSRPAVKIGSMRLDRKQ